ncbi:MAG: phosphatase PAP2 family protein [Deltaproteobacteria bacterium]|nr:phosphatase PAP2 family protein [Deltaproteobacteria bacterium]
MKKSFSTESGATATIQSTTVWAGSFSLGTKLLITVRAHALFIALVICYTAAGFIAAWVYDTAEIMSLSGLFNKTLGLVTGCFLLAFFCGHAIYVIIFVRPEHLTRYILTDLRKNYVNAERVLIALPILAFMPVFISVFTSFKTMIPFINPYSWDVVFVEWDAVLHGGVQPWQLLQPLLGSPRVTSIINFFYNLWFFVMYGVLLWQAFSLRDLRGRMQFFLTFIACWSLLGNLAATLFSSVGPCYYGRVTGLIDPFQPLMAYLWAANESFPVWSLNIQEMLWETHENGGIGFGSGISAMPSIHVSMAFLFAVVGWRNGRVLGIGFTVFAVLIVIGSVHLGWHYAIDDYAAIVGTWLIWRAVGWLLDRHGALLCLKSFDDAP